VCYNATIYCVDGLGIMAMVNYSYAFYYIKSNSVCFTY